MEEISMDEKIVSNEPVYQSCWVSYLGAVSGVLKSLGKDYDIIDVGGYSGYAFLINVSKHSTCPSGPTAHKAWLSIHQGTENLGVKIRYYGDQKGFPEKEGEFTSEDDERAIKLFEMVKEEINITDRPVILWGLPIPEYGIVKGYNESSKSFITSTFRHLINIPENPVKYNKLEAPGCLEALFFDPTEAEKITEEIDKKTIERAINMIEGENITHNHYMAGIEAYNVWAKVLEGGRSENIIYHGNSYVGACTEEGKLVATEFLDRLAKKYENKPQRELLKLASKEYQKAESLMKEFTTIFPFKMEGEMPKKKCLEGAQILRSAIDPETQALKYLKEILIIWE
jgi:hypothetical protein